MDATTNSLNWFEISCSDIMRAKKFYETVFEIELTELNMEGSKMATFPFTPGSGKANGSLIQSEMHQPSMEGSILYLNANPDLSVALSRVEAAGGKIIEPKIGIGEHGFVAWFVDTEGNRMALHSNN